MRDEPALELRNVWKSFPRHRGRRLLRSLLAERIGGQQRSRFYALRNVSLQVSWGQAVGIMGPNGAGKSTLLGVVAGLARPDRGAVIIRGRTLALLELAAGFHPDLTGAENLRLNASLMGLTRRRTQEVFEQIVEFAELADFIHEPLRTYSSGMIMRLAFSVAVHGDPEILIVDEVLAVGDQAFQVKCLERMEAFKRQGRTIVCATHSPTLVERLCDQAMWLDHGQVIMQGEARAVVEAYQGRTLLDRRG